MCTAAAAEDLGFGIPPPVTNAPRECDEREEEVLCFGFINKAPLPVDQAISLEIESGAKPGDYFVELMRKRLLCVRDLQHKWLSRARNSKRPRHYETQKKLTTFVEAMLLDFESQFGPASTALRVAPVRKHRAKMQ